MNRLIPFRRSVLALTQKRTFFGSTEKVTINFVNRANETHEVKARVDDTLLDTVLDNMVEFDGFGICGGGVACSTCHIVLEQNIYDQTDRESDEEWDMLENATGLTHTSRLGCCIKVTKDMDGATIRIPRGEDARWKVS